MEGDHSNDPAGDGVGRDGGGPRTFGSGGCSRRWVASRLAGAPGPDGFASEVLKEAARAVSEGKHPLMKRQHELCPGLGGILCGDSAGVADRGGSGGVVQGLPCADSEGAWLDEAC